jgi:hypothetical protein
MKGVLFGVGGGLRGSWGTGGFGAGRSEHDSPITTLFDTRLLVFGFPRIT